MTRVEKIREARRLRARGWTAPAIGHHLGVSDSTIRNWYLGGECADCGAPIEKSSLRRTNRCAPCSTAFAIANKIWTPEAIVDAIRRWGAAHGRAPRANDWLRADREGRYPNSRDTYGKGAPFASWADAVEAAGYERPRPGAYERTPEVRARISESRKRWLRARRAA